MLKKWAAQALFHVSTSSRQMERSTQLWESVPKREGEGRGERRKKVLNNIFCFKRSTKRRNSDRQSGNEIRLAHLWSEFRELLLQRDWLRDRERNLGCRQKRFGSFHNCRRILIQKNKLARFNLELKIIFFFQQSFLKQD